MYSIPQVESTYDSLTGASLLLVDFAEMPEETDNRDLAPHEAEAQFTTRQTILIGLLDQVQATDHLQGQVLDPQDLASRNYSSSRPSSRPSNRTSTRPSTRPTRPSSGSYTSSRPSRPSSGSYTSSCSTTPSTRFSRPSSGSYTSSRPSTKAKYKTYKTELWKLY